MADQRSSEQAEVAEVSHQPADAAADREADLGEDSSPCQYRDFEDTVWRCGDDYQLAAEMSELREDCPSYYLFPKTGRTYPLLQTLLADNGCDSTCRWDPTQWTVWDRCGPRESVVRFHSYQIKCQFHDIWYSSITGRLYVTGDEANATLPVCPDAGT